MTLGPWPSLVTGHWWRYGISDSSGLVLIPPIMGLERIRVFDTTLQVPAILHLTPWRGNPPVTTAYSNSILHSLVTSSPPSTFIGLLMLMLPTGYHTFMPTWAEPRVPLSISPLPAKSQDQSARTRSW